LHSFQNNEVLVINKFLILVGYVIDKILVNNYDA